MSQISPFKLIQHASQNRHLLAMSADIQRTPAKKTFDLKEAQFIAAHLDFLQESLKNHEKNTIDYEKIEDELHFYENCLIGSFFNYKEEEEAVI